MSDLNGIESRPELKRWFDKHIADTDYLKNTFHFGFEVQDVELKLVDMAKQIEQLQAQVKQLETENSELKVQKAKLYLQIGDLSEQLEQSNQWISVGVELPKTKHEFNEWDAACENCLFDGFVSDTFELSDGTPYKFARGHYRDDGVWVVYDSEDDFQVILPDDVLFYKPLPTPPTEGE